MWYLVSTIFLRIYKYMRACAIWCVCVNMYFFFRTKVCINVVRWALLVLCMSVHAHEQRSVGNAALAMWMHCMHLWRYSCINMAGDKDVYMYMVSRSCTNSNSRVLKHDARVCCPPQMLPHWCRKKNDNNSAHQGYANEDATKRNRAWGQNRARN